MSFQSVFINNILHKSAVFNFKQIFYKYSISCTNFNTLQQKCLLNNLNNDNKIYGRIHMSNNANQKLRPETENIHVYNIMQSLPVYKDSLAISLTNDEKDVLTENDFEKLLNKYYREESATVIVNAFKNACNYASINNIPLSDSRFDKLVDGLMDKCEDLTDEELSDLLSCINNYPRTDSPTSKNFNDIWSALDDMCCARVKDWSIQKTLLFADHWYLLGLAKYCDYSIHAIKKFCRKVNRLTPSELVQSLFYINVCRKQWSMFEIESRLEQVIDELTLNEMAIVSMAFFKTKTPFKSTFIQSRMLNKILENTSTVHEITLTAILKIVRYSPHISLVDQITEVFNKLIPEIDRLSILCCLHISLLGTNAQLCHTEILTKICEKFVANISSVRLKDLERFSLALTLYNFIPNTKPNIFESVLNELKKSQREHEIIRYPRCLPPCLHYLGLQQIYSYELINKVLDAEYIRNTYGKNSKTIGREIVFLDASVEIDCPDYDGNRLSRKLRNQLARFNSEWIPSRNQTQRLTAADKLMLDIVDVLEVICRKKDFFHIDYLLPHFAKPDIILCKDKSNNFIEVKNYFEKYKLGDVMRPKLENDLKWYAVVVGGWNMFIRGTQKPVGTLNTKLRQLKQIGYHPILIPWSIFLPLSRVERERYLRNKLS